jgi:glycosyltransferase involved in cell wall biosynthesis
MRKIAVIPAYNEELTIGSVVLCAKKYVDCVIVVDDGSTDTTSTIARAAGAVVLKHKRNLGKGAALQTGFKKANELNADIVVCLDADGQHPPTEIPSLIKPISEGAADVVIGSRMLEKRIKSQIPFRRRSGLRILTYTTNIGLKQKIKDTQSGFRAFSKSFVNAFSFREKGLATESEMIRFAVQKGLGIKEIPIPARYDVPKPSKISGAKHGGGVLWAILKFVTEEHPLLIFGLFGVISLLIGALFGAISMQYYYTEKVFRFGFVITSIFFIILGVLSIFTSIILNSLIRIVEKYKR